MAELRALIAAAGAGTRSGLPYPKTLYPIGGRPILVRLIEVLRAYDPLPVVVVSPAGAAQIGACLDEFGLDAELIEQPRPTGMGDAILRFRDSSGQPNAEHLLVAWGDVPFLQSQTIGALRDAHFEHDNDFTFVTRVVDEAYTIVERDSGGGVRAIVETREAGVKPGPGERDIGLFLFRVEPVLSLLEKRLDGAIGKATGEHGFLYVVRHLVELGLKVEALPIATELDSLSVNSPVDLGKIESCLERAQPRTTA